MKHTGILKSMPRIIAILASVLLLFAVIVLMGYVQNLLYSDVRINLTEIVTQNKDVIVSKLQVEVNDLDHVGTQLAKKMAAQGDSSDEALERAFREYVDDETDSALYVATRQGKATFPSGQVFDISGRRYFQFALSGVQNISDRIISRLSGDEIFAISVPIKLNGEIVGTVQKSYSPEEMYDLCSVSLFSDQGFTYIINGEGYILISSSQNEYNQETESYYRMLYSQGNEAESDQLKNDVKSEKPGFMETQSGNTKLFSAYTPIENVHDWYLISSVPINTVSPNASSVIKIFYVVLFIVVIIFAVIMLLFLSLKKKREDDLRKIAFVDPVTGGDTYSKFILDMESTLKEHPDKNFGVLAFDIDNFKYLNSCYGFDFGDRILERINKTISGMLTHNEHIARISSDHFVVLLEDTSKARLDEIIEAVRTEGDVAIYLSAGLYPISDPEESVNLMADKANTAARATKGSLKSRVEIYSKDYDEQIARNEETKRSIERALENDELVPFYQPKVDVNTGKLVGAEALVRWLKPNGELVPPIEFIPLCEKSGLIVDVDMTVLEKVLQFLRANLDAGVECVPVSVNFSRLHLMDNKFLCKVSEKLERYRIPPRLIEVELTESIIFDNTEAIAEFASRLHKLGLSIAMDDFGSGYSSLNMLKDIPIDVLKIDQGFLKETSNSDRQTIIFDAVARMANMLNINVVVEGVETAEHVNLMKRFDCSVAQGYFFARPMNEESFEEIYKRGSLC